VAGKAPGWCAADALTHRLALSLLCFQKKTADHEKQKAYRSVLPPSLGKDGTPRKEKNNEAQGQDIYIKIVGMKVSIGARLYIALCDALDRANSLPRKGKTDLYIVSAYIERNHLFDQHADRIFRSSDGMVLL